MTSNHGQTLRRALGILQLLQGPAPVLRVKDVVAQSELPKTTTLRLIAILRAEGLLYATGDGLLGPGPALLKLARSAQAHWQVSSRTQEVVLELANDSGETVSIFVVDDVHRVCVCYAESSQPVRYVVSIGDQLELSSGATSFVLLSDREPEFVDMVIDRAPAGFRARDLVSRVEKARADGYAISHGTREPGLSAVAAPITCGDRVAGALSVSGPSGRFRGARLSELLEMARERAERLSRVSTLDPVFRFRVSADG